MNKSYLKYDQKCFGDDDILYFYGEIFDTILIKSLGGCVGEYEGD